MEVVKDLTCPICLEFYSHPVILPCSHIMCKQPCAEQLFEGNFIRCPVCRDNCYVSGGLTSLPRVITIESIIEKIRAERKKRNATSQAQGRESSFDDVFSDVTSENRGSDRGNERTPVSSPSLVVPICNSPNFPEERSSPVSFSPTDLLDDATTASNALLRSFPSRSISSTPDTFTPSISSQETTPRNPSNDSTLDEQHHSNNVTSLRTTNHNTIITSNLPFSHPTHTHFNQHIPIPETTSRHPSCSGCRVIPHMPSLTATLSLVTETYSINRRSRQNTRATNFSFQQPPLHSESVISSTPQPIGSAGFSFSTNHSEIRPNEIDTETVGAAFATDQVVQTSTPRSDLRNIRLCHEQSLANLKACSDSIKALQQSRPFFRNSHHDNNLNGHTTGRSDTTNRHNRFPNEGNETHSFLGHITDILFDSSGSDGPPRINQTESENNHFIPSLVNPSNLYSSQFYNDIATSMGATNQMSPHFDVSQSVCESENNETTDVVEPMNSTVFGTGHQHSSKESKEDEGDSEVSSVKLSIQNHLQKLCDIQNQLLFHMNSFTERAQNGEDQYDRGRSDINKECDSLVAEIENKRYNFLLHIDDERKKRRVETNDTTVAMEKLLASSQELTLFVEEMLESRPQNILSTASSLLDSLSSAVAECQACLQTTSTENSDGTESDNTCNHHLVDTRLQRSLVQGLDYLSLPERPVFYVERCTRNTSIVALVLQPPAFGNAIDHYEIVYCSEEQKTLGIEERYYAKMPEDIEMYAGINPEVFPVVLIENLCQSTHYFFCACAVNRKGKSETSDYVQCKTLANRDCVVPVPSVIENRCQVGVTSATLTCPSLATVTSHQRVHHCLLQKTDNGASVWKGIELTYKREEFPVRKLRPETQYNFAVIVYNGRGECQVSNVVELLTYPMEPVNLEAL